MPTNRFESIARVALGVLAALAVAGAGPAWAQDSDDDILFGTDDSSADSTAEAPSSELTGGYPTAFLYRPRTLPRGAFEASADVTFDNEPSSLGLGSTDPTNNNPGGVGFAFGVTDKILVGARYGFAINSPVDGTGFEIKGVFSLDLAYLLTADESKQIVPQISLGYSVLDESFGPATAGAILQYDLADKLAVFFRPALVVLPGVDDMGETVRPISLEIPASLGYQFTNRVYAELGTLLSRAKVTDSVSGFAITDFFPVRYDLLVTLLGSQLDVGASVKVDFNPPDAVNMETPIADTLEFFAVARYRGGL